MSLAKRVKLTNLVPILWTNELEKTIQFYHDVIGFECVNRMEGWASLRNDDVELMLSLPNAHEPFDKIQFTGSFYFHADNVDQVWEQVKDKATTVYPIENFDYGMREFAIRLRTSTMGCASSLSAITTATFSSLVRKFRSESLLA